MKMLKFFLPLLLCVGPWAQGHFRANSVSFYCNIMILRALLCSSSNIIIFNFGCQLKVYIAFFLLSFFYLHYCGVSSMFLFPFECRQTLFYLSTFDRERAISRLQVRVS